MDFLEEEKTILKSLSSKFKWIARDKNGDLNLYETKPTKSVSSGYWVSEDYHTFNFFEGLFANITFDDKEPIKISDIFKGISENEI